MATATYEIDSSTLPATLFAPAEWSPAPSLPGLEPFRYVPVSADDLTPRRRLAKDVLPLGRWNVKAGVGNPEFWDIAPATLLALVNAFNRMKANGIQVNLCWGHQQSDMRTVDPRNLIAPIDQLFIVGNCLWCSVYVTPQQWQDLQNPVYRTSIRALNNFMDGAGELYAVALIHVAVVNLPVVHQQGPFVDMAISLPSPESPSKPGVKQMDPETIALFQRAFALLGIPFPESLDAAVAVPVIDALLSGAEQKATDPVVEPAAPAGDIVPAGVGADMGITLPAGADAFKTTLLEVLTPFADKLNALANTVTTLISDKSKAAKDAFEAKVESLTSLGKIKVAQKPALLSTGARLGYDLGILLPLDDMQAVPMGRVAQRGATASAPELTAPSADGESTQEQIDAGVRAFGGVVRSK